MEELLQKHRAFTLSVLVGGFVFLVSLLVRGCAVYHRDLDAARKRAANKAADLTREPVPDRAYLSALDKVVEVSDARVAELAGMVGRTDRGEKLWAECMRDVLVTIGANPDEKIPGLLERARSLPSAAFSLLLEDARTVLMSRASQADMEIQQADLGFERVTESDFTRNLAALAAVVRILDRSILEGVRRVEGISVGGSVQGMGGTEAEPFLRFQPVVFKMRGDPAVLSRVIKSVNLRDRDGRGSRLVLDEVRSLGRPLTIRAGEDAIGEFAVRVVLVNLEAREEETP